MAHRRAVRSLVVVALLVALSAPIRADELPPNSAPPYTGVYQVSTKSRVKANDEWSYFDEDTVTIATLNKQARWDYKRAGHTILIDRVGRSTTVFGGKNPPNTAIRTQVPYVTIGWEFGFATVEAATPEKPEVLGTTTIAGRECTRVRFKSAQYARPEFCVDKKGIVLRFANASSTAEAVYEAQSIDDAAPASNRFVTPSGYKVETHAQPRRELHF